MKYVIYICLGAVLLFAGCGQPAEKKMVYAVPVYGQSLASGEEAVRVTDFDSLSLLGNHSVLTQNLDEKFGYFADSKWKQWIKSVVRYKHRMFELSVYGMSEQMLKKWKAEGIENQFIICTFPGGRGAAGILDLGKGCRPYEKFLEELGDACRKARSKGWCFVVPAVCWMQGEDDVVWQKVDDYKKHLKTFQTDLDRDIRKITKQDIPVVLICYQTNCLTLSERFDANAFECKEMMVPQAQMELVRDDSLFMASGPTYPYRFVRERVHIDGVSQKRLGYLAGLSLYRLLHDRPGRGVVPVEMEVQENTVHLRFNVPCPPLVIDTLLVAKVRNNGFSVVDSTRTDILERAVLSDGRITLYCRKSPLGCKVRYAVNGLSGKSGFQYGPRGNLRDSQGDTEAAVLILGEKYPLHNWCYQFELIAGR